MASMHVDAYADEHQHINYDDAQINAVDADVLLHYIKHTADARDTVSGPTRIELVENTIANKLMESANSCRSVRSCGNLLT